MPSASHSNARTQFAPISNETNPPKCIQQRSPGSDHGSPSLGYRDRRAMAPSMSMHSMKVRGSE